MNIPGAKNSLVLIKSAVKNNKKKTDFEVISYVEETVVDEVEETNEPVEEIENEEQATTEEQEETETPAEETTEETEEN